MNQAGWSFFTPLSFSSLKRVLGGSASLVLEALETPSVAPTLDSFWYFTIASSVLNSMEFTTSSLLRLAGRSSTGHTEAKRHQFEAATLVGSHFGSSAELELAVCELSLSFLLLLLLCFLVLKYCLWRYSCTGQVYSVQLSMLSDLCKLVTRMKVGLSKYQWLSLFPIIDKFVKGLE